MNVSSQLCHYNLGIVVCERNDINNLKVAPGSLRFPFLMKLMCAVACSVLFGAIMVLYYGCDNLENWLHSLKCVRNRLFLRCGWETFFAAK